MDMKFIILINPFPLVLVPVKNFYHYTEDIKSPGGFYVNDNYNLKGEEGHSWFIQHLQTHSNFECVNIFQFQYLYLHCGSSHHADQDSELYV